MSATATPEKPTVRKELFAFLGKRFLKTTKADSVWWFTKIAPKAAIGLAWATRKGDFWYKDHPGDRSPIWFNRLELTKLRVREIYFGRLMMGVCCAKRKTPWSGDDIIEAVARTNERKG